MKLLLKITAVIMMMNNVLTPFSYVFSNEDEIFDVTENVVTENEEIEEIEEDMRENSEEIENIEDKEEVEIDYSEEISEGTEDIEDEENETQTDSPEEIPEREENIEDKEEVKTDYLEGILEETEDIKDEEDEKQTDFPEKISEGEIQDYSVENFEGQTGSEEKFLGGQEKNEIQVDSSISFQNDTEENKVQDSPTEDTILQTGSKVDSGENASEDQEKDERIIEEIGDEIQEIITKIRYFFKKEGDVGYIKYGRDSNNIGIITLKDPKTGVSMIIMDKNLGANSIGDNGYYFQRGNNHGVKTVNSNNKTIEKAIYNDSYYNRGYDGKGLFIVGSTDYWENGEHYNSLWGNESKESSRYGACPVGYHIPTIKEWNQLLNIWGNIHTQDNSEGKTILRYSANYSTRNIHTFKNSATQCEQGDTECVDENMLSIIVEILSSELKLPLAGSYDENGNFHGGLGVYWTSISKNGNTAGVFDMNAYIGDGENNSLLYKAQGHNIRCFQNLEPYEAPVNPEIQNEDLMPYGTESESFSDDTNKDSLTEPQNDKFGKDVEENIQNTYSENDILSDIKSDLVNQDTTGDLINEETDIKEYTITWKNEDGSIRDTTFVEYGQMPTHEDLVQPSDEKYSYKFAGWEPELKVVEGDAEYKAKYLYIPMEYTVTWKNEDGTVIDTTRVAYGQKPTHTNPVQPSDEKYSYKFAGWEPNLSEVKGDIEYRAKYEYITNKSTIMWKNEDGTIIDTTEVPYGEIPIHENPTQPADAHYSYEFSGRDPEVLKVTGPAEYRAIYKYIVNKYTVTWQNEDGTVLGTGEVEYGIIPEYNGVIPAKESTEEFEYIFVGWEPEIEKIKGDVVYKAKYTESSIIEDEESKDGDEIQTDASEQISQDNEQNIQDFVSESQNDGNIQSGTHGDENEGFYEGGNNTNENSSTNTTKRENNIQEGENSEKNQGFFGGIWETLKSFFLDDEDGYLRGSETINDIVVSVEAEEGIFPEGTEVIIKGIPQKRLESIQTSLVEDESNNVTENAQILAFDISFVYSGEEIQPTKEVSVKFNYKDNLDFQGALDKELSVYHIDDETDEGTEIQVANKNGDEIEILATDFSIYVLALSDSNSIELTLNPGDGTIITGNNIVVDEQGIGTITSVNGNVTLPDATRENHVFVGWYTSQTSSLQSFAGNGGDEYHVDASITLYAKWCNDGYTINTDKTSCILEGNLKTILDQNPNFTWGEKEIPMPLGWTNEEDPISIVMMDRNLGATTHGTESNAWGYYYQWGNNYGFTQNPPTILRSIANVNLSLYAPSTYYSGTYIIGKENNTTFPNWATTDNYNIWGYYSGTNEAKQGPCPTNWHVPTIEEWRKVVEYWSGNNGGMNVPNFRAELALPLAGGITRSTATLESGNIAGLYRTATPDTSKSFAYDFVVRNDLYDVNYSENLVNGRQVRCFKNEDAIVRRYTVTYNDGVDNREIFEDQIFSGLLRGDDFPQFSGQVPGRTGNDGTYHEFLGWFLEGTEIAFDVSGAKVIESVSLYAMWTGCPDGEEPNALGFCVPTAEEQRNRQIVQDLELYLLASDQNKIHYTIMDRNMGATEVFNKYYDAPNPASLGYLYQWGNNYGFPAQGNLAQQGVFIRTSQVPKNIWSAGVPSNYASGTYYSNAGSHASWMGSPSKTDGIWGGTGDTRNANGGNTTLEARQGPCPVGYHVPSTLEWTTIFIDWSGSNIGVSHAKVKDRIDAIYKFSEDLLLPPAGRRGPSGALDYISALSYWSSSPATSDAVRADGLYAKPDDKIEIPNADGRSRARSVRCVKNVVNTSATSIAADDIHLDGGGNAVISIDNGVISTLGTPTRADSTFNGWYTTSDFSGNPLSTGDTVSAGSSLYAKFTCNESGYVWNGIICEDGVRLIFDSMGGTEVSSQLIKSGTTGVRPADPTKTGYVFSGWYLTGETENEFNFTGTIITESTTLYAHWNTGQYEVSIVSNDEDYGTVDSGSIIADYGTPISTNENELTIGSTTVIAMPATSGEQYTYTFSGWTFENCGTEGSESVTTNCEITANFDRISNGYTVTWNNSDGTTLEIDLNVPYGTIPSYDGETPTSGGNAQYSYIFTGWSPATGVVQGDITYTATYTQSINEYTVMIQPSDINSGTVTTGFITVPYGTNISKSGNILEIGNETSTANPNSQTWQYDFAFVDWADTCGTTVTTGCTITANFQSLLRTYTLDLVIGTGIENIYYKVNGASEFINTGITTTISGVEAGSTIYAYAEAKPGYIYTETSESNPWSVILTGDNVFFPEAVAGGVQYNVYHYVKKVGSAKYDLVKIDTGIGITDEILVLSGLSKENEFPCAHYDKGSLTGTEDGPGEIVTQTIIKGDGSTKIYLYYVRTYHRIVLSGDEHVENLEGDGVRECGSERPIDATPKPGYHFVRWEERERTEEGGEDDNEPSGE